MAESAPEPASPEPAEEEQPPAALPGSQPIQPAINEPFDVIQVFYGTDRRPLSGTTESWAEMLWRFVPAAGAGLATLLLGVLAVGLVAYRRLLVGFAIAGAVMTLGCGFFAATKTLELVRRVDQEGLRYGTERSEHGQVEVGLCEVTIPKTHHAGALEGPSILKLQVNGFIQQRQAFWIPAP